MEHRLFDRANPPDFGSPDFYRDRERAPHLEQGGHQGRLAEALRLTELAVNLYHPATLSDLGAGDGGFLSTIRHLPVEAWGYDLQPSNIVGASERGVDVRLVDFLNQPVEYGDLSVCTEVLEHLLDPHRFLRDLPSRLLVASSPVNETADSHYTYHLFAWNRDGYRALVKQAGFEVVEHVETGGFQVLLGVRP
jgi:2-polyprenyl-3-methyl-5-hydroxy-6-metoxy-1,4-benzoquinol methylase